jgi:hypothetical protein
MLKNLIKLTLVFVVIICQNTSTALALFNYEFWCKKEPIEFSGEKTYPFDSLNEIDSYTQLPKFGLAPPHEANHNTGKELIRLVFKEDPSNHPDWVLAHGLLGTSMLAASPLEKAAFKSFFMSLNHYNFYKMNENQSLNLRNEPNEALFSASESLLVKRELAIASLSRLIHNRFTYDKKRELITEFPPNKNHPTHPSLIFWFNKGLNIYSQLKAEECNDHILSSLLGVSYALLKYDAIDLAPLENDIITDTTKHEDALKITLDFLKDNPKQSYKFLTILNNVMARKKLTVTDKLLVNSNKLSRQAMLTFIIKDMDKLKPPIDTTPKYKRLQKDKKKHSQSAE